MDSKKKYWEIKEMEVNNPEHIKDGKVDHSAIESNSELLERADWLADIRDICYHVVVNAIANFAPMEDLDIHYDIYLNCQLQIDDIWKVLNSRGIGL